MKQTCVNCDKVFYPTDNNYIGYPQCYSGYWNDEENRWIPTHKKTENKVFHSRHCQDEFLTKHGDYLSRIFRELKQNEREATNDQNTNE